MKTRVIRVSEDDYVNVDERAYWAIRREVIEEILKKFMDEELKDRQ